MVKGKTEKRSIKFEVIKQLRFFFNYQLKNNNCIIKLTKLSTWEIIPRKKKWNSDYNVSF